MERLHYAAVRLDDDADRLEDEAAERLVVSAAIDGTDWPGAVAGLETRGLSLPEITDSVGRLCIASADEAFKRYVAELEAENEDRADVQERTLERHFSNQRRTLGEVRDNHERLGRAALVKDVTYTLDVFVYNMLRSGSPLGYPAAAAFLQSVVGFFLILITNAIVRKARPDMALF